MHPTPRAFGAASIFEAPDLRARGALARAPSNLKRARGAGAA